MLGGLLDPAIELDEADAQPPRELLADGRLAGAAQAEQRDHARRVVERRVSRSAGGISKARASSASRLTEMLARPASSWTRKRTDTPGALGQLAQRPAPAPTRASRTRRRRARRHHRSRHGPMGSDPLLGRVQYIAHIDVI